MMVIAMKKSYRDGESAVVLLVCVVVLGLSWSATASAEEAAKPEKVAVATPVPAQRVRLPALKLGGIRSGHVLMITESGTENVRATMLAQVQMRKPPLLSEFCLVH
jgi:hypothetical protein